MTISRPWLLLTPLLGCLLFALPALAQGEGEGDEPPAADDDDSAEAEATEEASDDEAPADEAPADEAPADEAPADEAPAEDAAEPPPEDTFGAGEEEDEWGDADLPSMGDEGGEGSDEGDDEGDGPDAGHHSGDEDDIDDWGGEIERQDLNQVVEREEVRVEVEAEPERIGISGNWYQVGVDCLYCETVLGQSLDVQDPLVMRQFFDHFQLEPDTTSGKMVFPSEGINRPLTVVQDGDRVIIFRYVIDEGERATPLYCTIWDLRWLLRDQKLLYGRRYSVDAYQMFAFGQWENGYKADETFLPREQLMTFLNLDLVRNLSETHKTFPVGEKAVLTYLGSDAFVRSDFESEPMEDLQNRLFKEQVQLKEQAEERRTSFDDGCDAFEEGEYERALTLLLRAGELGEDSLDFHFYVGGSYQGMKDYDKAKEHYRIVLDGDPMDTVTRYNLARILERQGLYKEALNEYRVILKHDPEDEEARDRAFDLAMQLQD